MAANSRLRRLWLWAPPITYMAVTPGRNFDIHDWLADTLGGALGIAVYALAVTMSLAWARSRTATGD